LVSIHARLGRGARRSRMVAALTTRLFQSTRAS
jgi:hypothetical protein